MKKTIFAFVCLQVLTLSIIAQNQDSDAQKLKRFNQEVVEDYKAGKFDDALKAARQTLDLSIKIYGAESNETASVYVNLGEICRSKQKNAEAEENLQKALAIYRNNPAQNKTKIPRVLESLGTVLALDGKKQQAETFFSQNVSDNETFYGKESKEVISALESLGTFYIYTKQYDKVDEIFTSRYLLTRKIFGKDSDDLDKIQDEHQCFAYQNFSSDEAKKRQSKYEDALNAILNPEPPKDETKPKKINGGVTNGKALSLPKPEYPLEARKVRAGGVVLVKIVIEESGKVSSATASCGHSLLRKASEEAALKATFRPTLLEGSPVSVTGFIVYNYVP